MERNNRKTGNFYEKQAGVYLKDKGYQILEYNFRCPAGEVDIIAKDGKYLVFCEVKYRSSDNMGTPAEAVDIKKQKRISKCAVFYMQRKGIPTAGVPCRFDVVTVNAKEEIELIQNAFDYVE